MELKLISSIYQLGGLSFEVPRKYLTRDYPGTNIVA